MFCCVAGLMMCLAIPVFVIAMIAIIGFALTFPNSDFSKKVNEMVFNNINTRTRGHEVESLVAEEGIRDVLDNWGQNLINEKDADDEGSFGLFSLFIYFFEYLIV